MYMYTCICNCIDPLCDWGRKVDFLKTCCYGNKTFFGQCYCSGYSPYKVWDSVWSTAGFIKILDISEFSIGFVLQLAHFYQLQYKPMEIYLILIKSAVELKDLKLGMVITWRNSIVQKSFVTIATCLEESIFRPQLCKGSMCLEQHSCCVVHVYIHNVNIVANLAHAWLNVLYKAF